MAHAKQPNKLWLAVASLLAWVYEMLQKHRANAKIHVQAAGRLLEALEAPSAKLHGSEAVLVGEIKQMWRLSSSYTKFLCYDDASINHSGIVDSIFDSKSPPIEPQSVLEVRDALLGSTKQYLRSKKDNSASREYLSWLRRWHISMRAFCSLSATESHLFRKTAQILFNVGMAFLPKTRSGAFSIEAGPHALNHIMNALERIIEDTQKSKSIKDRNDIEETLEMTARLILRHTQPERVPVRLTSFLGDATIATAGTTIPGPLA
jgi:hypothetical protein